jgi:thiamine transport system permease protein
MGPALGAVPGRLREAAATLGADPGAVWRLVEWPVVARAAMVGAGFSFAISLGEFGATAFVARPADPTLPLLVYRALGRPGTGDVAAAGSLLLMVVTVLAVLAVDRFRTGEETL